MKKGRIRNGTSISALTTVDEWKLFRQGLIQGILSCNADQDDWQKAFDLLHTRIKTRFLNPIDWILEKRHDVGEGFSAVALQCILIEFLEACYQGKVYTTSESPRAFEYNSSRKLFSDFLMGHKPFSDCFKEDANANGFFDNIRCGLLHEAATKETSRINNAPDHDKLVLFNPDDPKNMQIFRENFHKALLDYIESYKVELLSDSKLKINFVRKMDDICGIRRAYYFAYGSNMDPERLLERQIKYHMGFRAVLNGYKFLYNKRSTDGSAKANVEVSSGEYVYGVCYEIDDDDFELLRKYERGYCRRNIEVSDIDGKSTKAVTYISDSIDNSLLATSEYKRIVLKGARHWRLKETYISQYLDK